jgi:hypothetical protein
MVHSLPSTISVPAASPSLQPFNDATDPLWAKYHEHCSNFAWLIGHEVTHSLHKDLDFNRALNELAVIQPFGVDRTARTGLAHTMDILGAHGTRFDDNTNLKHPYGENSATHSVMAVLLSDYILNRAEHAGADRSALKDFRQDAAISLLLHDAGEAFGEFSTKSEQAKNEELKKDKESLRKYEAEYLVLRYVLTQSLRVAAGEITEDAFKDDIKRKRQTLGFEISPREGLEKRMDAFRDELNVEKAPLINLELLATRNQLMHYWVATEISPHLASAKANAQSASASPELQTRFELFEKLAKESAGALKESSPRFTPEYAQFLGNYVKMIDDIQGARHYNKFLRKNQQVTDTTSAATSTPLAPKSEIIDREVPKFYLGMLEKNLPRLHESAKGLPWASPIANWVSALSYQTASASIELMHPPEFPLNKYNNPVKPRATPSDKARSENLQMRAEQGWWSAVYKNARDAAIAEKIEPTTDFMDARVRNYLSEKPEDYTLPDAQAAATLGFNLPSFPDFHTLGKVKE